MSDASNESQPDRAPKNNVQWGILVFWALLICAWSWYVSAFAAIDTGEGNLGAIGLWVVALTPPALAVWKYPTGRRVRSAFALVAFALPAYLVAELLVRLFRG